MFQFAAPSLKISIVCSGCLSISARIVLAGFSFFIAILYDLSDHRVTNKAYLRKQFHEKQEYRLLNMIPLLGASAKHILHFTFLPVGLAKN